MASSSPVIQNQSGGSIEKNLDTLVNEYTTAQGLADKLVFLHSLTHQVLPGLALVDLEASFLSKVIPQAYDSIVESLASITNLLKTLRTCDGDTEPILQNIQALLQAVIGCIECLESCIVQISKFSSELSICDMHSLPPAALKIIRSSFDHCKQSESLYGGYFQQFSEELSGLFKKTYQLQKVLMELIERVQLDADEKEVIDIAEVCHQLLEICGLISDVDTGLLVNTWKVLNRLITKHKELLKNHVDVDRILKYLCEAVEAKIAQCISLASQEQQTVNARDAKVLNRMLKVVRFLIGHLMHVVKEYEDYIDGSIADLLSLLVRLQSISPSSISAPKITSGVVQELTTSITIVVEPLLKILINNAHFVRLLTRKTTVQSSAYDAFGFCQVLISTTVVLTQATEAACKSWMVPTNYPEEEPRFSLFQAVVESLRKCTVELSLPVYLEGVMFEGKPLRQVSFYQYVCTKFSALIASIPASCFHVIESCLVEALLQEDALSSVLPADLWTFMARWGSADLCRNHMLFLCSLLLSLPYGSIASANVSVLIRRLTPLMAKEHQESLIDVFPPSKSNNALLWSVIPLDKLPVSVRSKACRDVVPVCIKHLTSCWPNNEGALHRDIQYFSCLRSVYGLRKVTELVPPVHHAAVLNFITSLWSKATQGSSFKESERVWLAVLDLTSLVLSYVQPKDYAQILRGLKALLLQFKSLDIKIKVAQLLGSCGTIEITQDVETAVFSYISSLFSSLISDKHWFAHHAALQAVKAFVEVTPYTHIMSDCVPEPLLPLLSDFLNQVPYQQKELSISTIERDKEILTRQRDAVFSRNNNVRDACITTSEGSDIVTEPCDTDATDVHEPAAKRSRTDSAGISDPHSNNINDDSYSNIIKSIKTQLTALVTLRSRRPPQESTLQELRALRNTLDSVINSRDTGT